jgi:hypothetical protein
LDIPVDSIDHVLKRPSRFDPDSILSEAVKKGIEGVIRALGARRDWYGGAIRSAASGKAVLRGALALYGTGKRKAARELIALLHSRKVFEKALTELVNEHFNITAWTIPE